MSLLRLIWRFLRLLLHTLAGAGLALGALLRRRPPDPEAVRRWYDRFLSICGVRLHCSGTPPEGPALIVANHLSWLDIPTIGACSHAAFLSKQSIRYWPLVGWFAVAAGTLFIRRGRGESSQVAAAIAHRLGRGGQMALFPEGRVGDGQGVQRFFPRLFAAAIESGAPVVPVALRYCIDGLEDREVHYVPGRTFLGILLRVLMRPDSEVQLMLCPPIDPSGKDRRTLAEEARLAILTALEQAPGCESTARVVDSTEA